MHGREVLFHDKISGTVGDCSKSEGRFRGERVGESGVLHSGEVEELLPGDHEGGEVGSVDGEEDEGEESPDVGHQSGGVTLGTVHIDCSFEEDNPDQPQSPDK